jgi:hypothetical protein
LIQETSLPLSIPLYPTSYSLRQRLDVMAEPLQLTAPNGTKYTQPTGK